MHISTLLKVSIYILVFLISLQFSAEPAFAQGNTTQIMRISPIVLKVILDPGTKQTYKIKVENLLDTPLPIRVSNEGFDASDEGGGIRNSNQEISSLANWIRLSTSDVIIPAQNTHEFEAEVLVPEKVPVGGYFAMIFFSPVLPSKTVAAKVGVVLLANIGVPFDKKNNGEITQFSFDKKLFEQSPVSTTIRIKNTSLNYFSAKPTLTIKALFGQDRVFELEEKTILPGKVRRWQKSYDLGKLYHGIYRTQLAVSLEKGDFIYSQTYFFGFPLTKAVVVILSAGLIMYGLLFRKRVAKALRLLLKG